MRTIVAAIADLHAGSTRGLMNPDTVLLVEGPRGTIEKYNPRLSPYQEYLWEIATEHREKVIDYANGDDIILIIDGDITHGTHYRENWVTTRLADQPVIAFYSILPWLEFQNVRTIRLAKGTGVHTFGEGSGELLVANMLQTAAGINAMAAGHGSVNIDGVEIDYAHHGPSPGSRFYLEGNIARLYLIDMMMKMLREGLTPPRIVFRAHYHTYIPRVTQVIEWGGKEYETTLILLPSYCGPDDWTIGTAKSPSLVTHGLVLVEIENERVVGFERFTDTLDVRIKESL